MVGAKASDRDFNGKESLLVERAKKKHATQHSAEAGKAAVRRKLQYIPKKNKKENDKEKKNDSQKEKTKGTKNNTKNENNEKCNDKKKKNKKTIATREGNAEDLSAGRCHANYMRGPKRPVPGPSRAEMKEIQKELNIKKCKPLVPVRGMFNQGSPPTRVRVGSDCSGLGSELYALKLAKIECVSEFASECKTALHEIFWSIHEGRRHSIETDATNPSTTRTNVDLYVAGPPCQSWSTMGKRAGLADMKGRGIVFYSCLTYVKTKRPRVAVFENVVGLKSHFAREFLDILSCLEKANYHVTWDLINALDNGVPHQRSRVYIVAIARESLKHEFTFPRKLKTIPPVDLFLDNNPWRGLPPQQGEIARRNICEQSRKLADEGAEPQTKTCFIDVYSSPTFTQSKAGVCPCITATRGSQGGFHITNQRRMTSHEELARLQGWTSPAFERMRRRGNLKLIGHALGNGMSVNVLYRVLPRALYSAGLLKKKTIDVWKHVNFAKADRTQFKMLPDDMYKDVKL